MSLESAAAVFGRLQHRLGGRIDPEGLLALDAVELASVGFSRQKARYVVDLAEALVDGSVDLDGLVDMDDATAERTLTGLRGVGPWTARCYLLFCVGRSDIWPTGDRALIVAAGRLVAGTLDAAAADDLARRWSPSRSVAARILWHDYLASAGRAAPSAPAPSAPAGDGERPSGRRDGGDWSERRVTSSP